MANTYTPGLLSSTFLLPGHTYRILVSLTPGRPGTESARDLEPGGNEGKFGEIGGMLGMPPSTSIGWSGGLGL